MTALTNGQQVEFIHIRAVPDTGDISMWQVLATIPVEYEDGVFFRKLKVKDVTYSAYGATRREALVNLYHKLEEMRLI